MLPDYFVYIGAFISFIGGLSYVIDVIKGRNQPNLVSWSMWALAPFIAFASQIYQSVGTVAVFTFVAGFNPLLVIAVTLFNKIKRIKATRFDIACGALSLLGLLLWYITDKPNIAILFSIFADAMAAIPTIVKSYKTPESESSMAFFSTIIAAVFTLLTITNWNFQNTAFTFYILAICTLFVLLIRFKVGIRLTRALSGAK